MDAALMNADHHELTLKDSNTLSRSFEGSVTAGNLAGNERRWARTWILAQLDPCCLPHSMAHHV